MENKVLKLGVGGGSTQDVSVTINSGNSERWTIQSQKTKYVNGKSSGVIGVGYTASINNSDYLLEEDKSNNQIQITAQDDGTSGLCILTQNESGNKINLHLTTPVTQKPLVASTFTLSGLPTDTGYYLFGRGARPQNTPSSGQMYIQGLSATGTTTMKIPFYANDSEPGSRIECTTGNEVAVYTKSGATWISEGSFIVPSAGGTVSI